MAWTASRLPTYCAPGVLGLLLNDCHFYRGGSQELGCPAAVEGRTDLKTEEDSVPRLASELGHHPCALEPRNWNRSEGLALKHQHLALPSRATITVISKAIIYF